MPLPLVPTGIAGLDAILSGGLSQSSLTIVQGQHGAGKTILGNQMCHNHVRSGGRALYVTLLAENHAHMLQHMGSLAFFDASVIPECVFYISAFRALDEGGLRGLLRLLWEEIRRHEATLLVLDGLVMVELQADSEMAFRKFIHELQSQAVLAGCGMVLLTSAGGESIPPTAEHTMVDAVVEMRSRLYGWRAERDLEVLKRRGAGFLRGRHAFRISDAGVEVFPRFEAMVAARTGEVDTPYSLARASTGVPALDGMVGGGFPLGSTTLLTGPSGAGKTTLALQFLGQCSAAEPGLLLTTSESPSALLAKAAAMGLRAHGLMMAGHVSTIWSPGVAGLLDEVAGQVLAEVEHRGARRLVVDDVLGLMRLAPDPGRVPHILAALRLGMRARGITTLLTVELDSMGALPPGAPDMSGIPENLLFMRLSDSADGLVRTLQVRKARNTAIDSRARTFGLGGGGLHLAPQDDPGMTDR